MKNKLNFPGARFITHGVLALAIWAIMIAVNDAVDPLMSYYLALVGMYATAMFGMAILVGLSGQVSLGNGALMAVGGYVFALTSLNWQTVPFLGLPWNAVWSVIFAGLGGVVIGLIVGGIAARLKGPYLAGLTLGLAVGIPAIANRFPETFGGENGLMLTVPYPEGGYASSAEGGEAEFGGTAADEFVIEEPATEQAPLEGEAAGGEVADEDLLSIEDLGGVDDGGAVLAEEDILTLDDLGNDAVAPVEETFTEEVPLSDVPDIASDPAGFTDPGGFDAGFILEQWQASVSITVACIVGFIALNLVRGRQGRVWQAVRDDPVAAAVSGISPSGAKISAVVVSSLFASLAGAVFAQLLSYVGPGAFGLGLSLSLLVGIVLGGRSSLLGAIIGAVLLVWLPEFVLSLSADRGWDEQITNNAPNLIYGLLVVLVVLVAPGGIVGTIRSFWDKASQKKSERV
jgi:ABC-type branched-subunit amino acid transport system permease subunit